MILAVVVGVIVVPFALAGDTSQKASSLQWTAHADGTFSVISRSTPLEVLLSKITETANVDIYVDSASKKRLVTIDVKRSTLIQLLERIAGGNYAMVYDGRNVSALHVLPQGKTRPIDISEFSGKVKIGNRRAQMFFMPADNSTDTTNDYIKKRHEALAKLARKDPDKEIQAQISLQGYMSAKQATAFVKENQLDPVTLNIGWKEHGGGHDLQSGESIEAAIESATLFQEELISLLLEDAGRQVASMRQQGMRDAQMEAELEFQKSANDLSLVFYTKGLTIYGIRVAASAKQLHKLTSNDQKIRLVDPLWGGLVEDEIANVYPMTKIAIPLVPENDTFIPVVNLRSQRMQSMFKRSNRANQG